MMAGGRMAKKLQRLMIICGGTGGHFYPGLTIARTFIKQGGAVKMLLNGRHVSEQSRCAESYGIQLKVLPNTQAPVDLKRSMVFSLQTMRGIFAAGKEIKKFKPDAIIAMGSFNCIPASLAAASLSIPFFLHEGNARIGKANMFLSKWAKHMMLSFPPVNAGKCRCPWSVTGMPVRPELSRCEFTKVSALRAFNRIWGTKFDDEKPVFLIFGGSQGAESINKNIPEALCGQEDQDFQVIHISGEKRDDELKEKYKKAGFPLLVLEKTEDMDILYSAADFVICRAGGSTIAELACLAKFAVLIPYPYAADNHQFSNARYFASSGAGKYITDKNCTPDKMTDVISDLLEKEDFYLNMAVAAKELARPKAAEDILRLIEEKIQPD